MRLCRSAQAPGSDRTEWSAEWSARSARVAWAKCIGPGTRGSGVRSPSKPCPSSSPADPDRVPRFEREAQMLASLNHPHIAALYGLEEAAAGPGGPSAQFLMLELVEGGTLADRLSRALRCPLDDVLLQIARQSRRGARTRPTTAASSTATSSPPTSRSHRDARAKVLDLGLAKAFDAKTTGSAPDRSLTADARHVDGTQPGRDPRHRWSTSAPSRRAGKPLDKRTDIWSFGCVTFEALTGRHPFSAETLSDMTAAILGRDPDWSGLGSRAAGLWSLICYALTRHLTGPVLRLRAAARRLADGELSARATRHSATPRRDRRAGS